jgi:hypothetical protein
VSGHAHEVMIAYLSYHQASELICTDNPITMHDIRSSAVNSDLEAGSSETLQCHIVYPTARPDIPIRICHLVEWVVDWLLGWLIRWTLPKHINFPCKRYMNWQMFRAKVGKGSHDCQDYSLTCSQHKIGVI